MLRKWYNWYLSSPNAELQFFGIDSFDELCEPGTQYVGNKRLEHDAYIVVPLPVKMDSVFSEFS